MIIIAIEVSLPYYMFSYSTFTNSGPLDVNGIKLEDIAVNGMQRVSWR